MADITTGDPFMDEYALVMGNIADLAKVCVLRSLLLHHNRPASGRRRRREKPGSASDAQRRNAVRRACWYVHLANRYRRAKATLRDDVTQRLQKTVNKPRGVSSEIVQDRTRKIATALAAIDAVPDGVSMMRKPMPVRCRLSLDHQSSSVRFHNTGRGVCSCRPQVPGTSGGNQCGGWI